MLQAVFERFYEAFRSTLQKALSPNFLQASPALNIRKINQLRANLGFESQSWFKFCPKSWLKNLIAFDALPIERYLAAIWLTAGCPVI
jgi:hypothetical protein